LFAHLLHLGYNLSIMDTEKSEYFRQILHSQMEELLGEAGKTVSGMSGTKEGNLPDPTDRAAIETDRNFLLRVKDRERKLIIKLDEAIKRVDGGTYGICERCGEEISEKRLEARPVTTFCIECKTEEEALEKQRGG
jgi:DnaK suppressor protein